MAPRKQVPTWGRTIDRFLTEFEIDGATEATLTTYRWVLERMARFYEAKGYQDPLALSEDDLLDVLGYWRKLATTTRAGRISVIKTFYRWAAKRYKIPNPAAELNRPKKQKVARRRLSDDDLERILHAGDSERDKLVLWMLAMTGLRRGEVIALKWSAVDFSNGALRVVLGKGRKGREVPIPNELVDLLRDTKASLEERGAYNPSFYVCPRTRIVAPPGSKASTTVWPNEPMGEATPNKLLVKAAAAAGVPMPNLVSPHDLRRAYAGKFLKENPGDIRTLQALLGHADIGTTQLYLPDSEQDASREKVQRVRFITSPEQVPDSMPEEAPK
jgi:integrase/recombinase XerD